MGTTTCLGLGIGILLLCINVASSSLTVDLEVTAALKEVTSGTKSYTIFVLDASLNTLNLEKCSDGDFTSLTDDLKKAKQAAQPKYALLSISVKGLSEKKLVLVVWIPLSTSLALQKAYKEECDHVIEVLNVDVWVILFSGSESDLDLNYIIESGTAGYNIIESAEYCYYVQETIEVNKTVTITTDVTTEFTKVLKKSSSYIILGISLDFSSFTIDKVGAKGAGFDELVAIVKGSTSVKLACLFVDLQIGLVTKTKLVFIKWIPVGVSDEDRVKIEALVAKFRLFLNVTVDVEFPVSLAVDLNLEAIANLAIGGNALIPSVDVQLSLDVGAKAAIDQLTKGSIRYATFKCSDDLVVVDKVASLNVEFNVFIDDLVKTQNDKQPRFVVYLAPFKVKGVLYTKLVLILWIPFNVNEKLRSIYEIKLNSFKVLSKLEILLDVKACSVADLNLDAILRLTIGKDYQGLGTLGGNILGQIDVNLLDLKIDVAGLDAVGQLTKGLKRYCLFGLLNGQLVLDKIVDISLSFDLLKADLISSEKAGEPRYALFLAPVNVHGKVEQKIILIIWVPPSLQNVKRLLYLSYLIKLRLALGFKPWLEFVAVTLDDLQLSALVTRGLQYNLLELSIGPLELDIGSSVLNPIGVIGCLLGNGLNLAGGLVGFVLKLGVDIVNGVLVLGTTILYVLLGGIFGNGGLLGGLLGGGTGGGLLSGLLG